MKPLTEQQKIKGITVKVSWEKSGKVVLGERRGERLLRAQLVAFR